ncbi:MAG: APC family permease [Acidobacteria bacterium]|nr:MAG: APC family permease [Acidobacteriota bacterium]
MAEPTTGIQSTGAATPRLKRVLTVWDLVFYGIVLVQPIAPVPLYGVAQKLSDGHFVTIILIALLAMLITAVSYGRMATLYPTAGSAYTYVGKGLNPHLGFLAGWAMILDYLLQPLINTVWMSTALHERYLPMIPYIVWAAIIAGIMTLLNLAGIKSSAVVAWFVVVAIRYLYGGQGWAGILSTQPLYNPATFDAHRVLTATSFAALTYIGFDGVTTLAEDVENPKRNVLLAVVLTCIFAGVCSAFEAYLGARVWPDWRSFPNLETAFMDICRRVGGLILFNAMGIILIVAAFGSGLTGTLGAARLLFGMGRDGVLPRKTFGYLKPGSSTPTFNIVLIGLISFAGAVLLNYVGSAYEHAGELLNFGAFLAFMGVNFATFWQFTVARQAGYKTKFLQDAIVPLIGFAFCGLIWWNLNTLAKTVGGIWFVLGLVYVGIRTRGFRAAPVMIDFSES